MTVFQVVLSAAGTVAGALVAAATFLTKFIKNVKAKKAAEQIIKIGTAVLPYVKQAENFAHYTGAEKKEYVLTKANQFAIEQDMVFDVGQVSAKIEELVELTKSVNMRDKDKACAALSATAAQYAECMCGSAADCKAQETGAGTM